MVLIVARQAASRSMTTARSSKSLGDAKRSGRRSVFSAVQVAQVEPAGGVQGVFGGAGEIAGGENGDFVAVFTGQVDREAPSGG